MQTLRKKTSPLKYKNETTKFLGDGMTFKAKLIGILEVSEARGDRMCQEALSDLKMAIRAAGEHKQRIVINIAIDGLRLRDEKTGDSLYHHPVHKISFICQDMTDSRAFGYIFGSPDTGHRFFGIKTDKAANQVVIAMRDLFQVVFALKKKEVEMAKQHLDKNRYSNSPMFTDSSISSSKNVSQETSKNAVGDSTKTGAVSEIKTEGTAVADLVDLELELNSLQQGINQMEKITPSDPFGSKDDPFGDSFITYTRPILPPPPSSGRDRSTRSSESSSIFSPKSHLNFESSKEHEHYKRTKEFSFNSEEQPNSADWFAPRIFEEPSLVPDQPVKDEKHELTKKEIMSQFDVFTELDPLELKNPPKKVLKDLVSQSQSTITPASTNVPQTVTSKISNEFDPFGEDPFIVEDPFAEFSKQDPFETEFGADFKVYAADKLNNLDQKGEFRTKSPLITSTMEKQTTLSTMESTPPRHTMLSKQNTFDVQFTQLHENQSLDMSSESECAPEPPPRPVATLSLIKPPPLPPKKQANDMTIKPPPRPPAESHYDYMDNYETASTATFGLDNIPPIPLPQRKAKFESDFIPPERPKKINLSDEDYLTPVTVPEKRMPPPKLKKENTVVDTLLDGKEESKNLDGLDITLSQLTISGLNELATKLNIPTNQLSNMTLVELTNFLSNFIKNKSIEESSVPSPEPVTSNSSNAIVDNVKDEFPTFKADFASNFNNVESETFDRYAVFRELIKEEIKQTKIDTEPEELLEEKEKKQANYESVHKINVQEEMFETDRNNVDKYAALREIVESELKISCDDINENKNNEEKVDEDKVENEYDDEIVDEYQEQRQTEKRQNIENTENNDNTENNNIEENNKESIFNLLKYKNEENKKDEKISPIKTPSITTKSPLPNTVTDIIQNTTRITSGSLSDVVSGSSPEIDNTASNSEVGKKELTDVAGESWAIFDQANIVLTESKEKQANQSEEGVSPWSSDSKEFGNGSPTEWRRPGSGSEEWDKRRSRRSEEGWWDTAAEPELQCIPPSHRRSTDSYEDEYYDCYDKPRRRKIIAYHSGQTTVAGGHSSSSRDVSPWEEEPRRRQGWQQSRHSQRHGFDKHHRPTDSWDEEDDYDYDEEELHRFHRHESRDERWSGDNWSEDRRSRKRRETDRERWCCPDWEHNEYEKSRYGSGGRWSGTQEGPGWRERKYDEHYYNRESQESPWEDDYSNDIEDIPSSQYLAAKRSGSWKRPSSASEIDRKTGEIKSRHYLGPGGSDGERDRRYKSGRRSRSRDSQYAPPVDRHRHKPEQLPINSRIVHHKPHKIPPTSEYITGSMKKSEKPDYTIKKSSSLVRKKKDSPKLENVDTFPRKKEKSLFENDFISGTETNKRISTNTTITKINFENDFETSEVDSPTNLKPGKMLRQFESKIVQSFDDFGGNKENCKQRLSFKEPKTSPRLQKYSKSMFEDDFTPNERTEMPEDTNISSIKEEADPIEEEEHSFSASKLDATNSRKKKMNRLNNKRSDVNLKKSESVNIFARENDPFDDDFFCENMESIQNTDQCNKATTDLKWTDDFDDFSNKK